MLALYKQSYYVFYVQVVLLCLAGLNQPVLGIHMELFGQMAPTTTIALIFSSDLWSLGSIEYSNENCIAMVHL